MTDSPARVTVVVVTFRGRELLPACLDSLAAQTVPHELLVVDNYSTDGTQAYLAARLPADQVLRLPSNTGFAGGVAAALERVRTPWVALLNDDAAAAPDWLQQLLTVADADPAAAAWTSLLLLADHPDHVNNAGVRLTRSWYGADLGLGEPVASIGPDTADVFGFCGGAALLRTDAVRQVGGFPAEFFLYYEDLDTSWRLRLAGWEIRRVPQARVAHAHSATSDQRSVLFHEHNERNRLLTLYRCAPLSVAVAQTARFALTTGSLTAKRLLRRPVPVGANLRTGLRLRVLATVAARLPALLRQRRSISRLAAEAGVDRSFATAWRV